MYYLSMDGRTISHEVLEHCRFTAIKLHRKNVPVNDIADSFGVTRQAVYRWINKEKENGKNSLKSTIASGPDFHLNESQLKNLLSSIRKPASKFGYATDLWSGPRIRHLIKHQFKIEYHPKHMPRLMKNLGLELKFPERRALEQDSKELRIWKNERFPEILKIAKKKHALLFYADEAIISLIPYIGKTWAFPSKKPIVRVTGRRGQNIGITAAVNQQGRLCFELTKEKERFTAKIFIRFLKKLMKQFSNRFIILIVDGAPTHTAGLVKQFVAKNKKILKIEILPAYSPELNPTEKCWRFLKTKKLDGSMAIDKNELRDKTKKHMREIKKDKNRMSSFFDEL
jgi:transposase